MAQCWLSMADNGCLPREWFELIRVTGSDGLSVHQNRNLYHAFLRLIQVSWKRGAISLTPWLSAR